MSDFSKNYYEKEMTLNAHDREFFKEQVDVIYNKTAEVVIAQNERFFQEQETQGRLIMKNRQCIDDHERRIQKLEKIYLQRIAIRTGIIIIALVLLSFLIF